jgi:hypothetical protein
LFGGVHSFIYKSNSGVCLSAVTNRARRPGQTPTQLAARSNRLGGLLAVQISNLHPNQNIYNKKIRIFLKKKIETK